MQAGLSKLNFEGRSIKLVPTCGMLATLSLEQGCSAAQALPDNLAALFRPVRLPAADLHTIAHALLCSHGMLCVHLQLSTRLHHMCDASCCASASQGSRPPFLALCSLRLMCA